MCRPRGAGKHRVAPGGPADCGAVQLPWQCAGGAGSGDDGARSDGSVFGLYDDEVHSAPCDSDADGWLAGSDSGTAGGGSDAMGGSGSDGDGYAFHQFDADEARLAAAVGAAAGGVSGSDDVQRRQQFGSSPSADASTTWHGWRAALRYIAPAPHLRVSRHHSNQYIDDECAVDGDCAAGGGDDSSYSGDDSDSGSDGYGRDDDAALSPFRAAARRVVAPRPVAVFAPPCKRRRNMDE